MSCGSEQKESTEHTESKVEKTFSFQCPMKCQGSGKDTEGKCNVCKMDLVQM